MLAIVTLVGVIITSVFSFLTAVITHSSKKEVSEINDAVNHRHEKKGPTALKLYDLAWENHKKTEELLEWKRSYEGGPLDNGHKVKDFVEDATEFVEDANERIEKLEDTVNDLAPLVRPNEKKDKDAPS